MSAEATLAGTKAAAVATIASAIPTVSFFFLRLYFHTPSSTFFSSEAILGTYSM
jgi:hypothetical protein